MEKNLSNNNKTFHNNNNKYQLELTEPTTRHYSNRYYRSNRYRNRHAYNYNNYKKHANAQIQYYKKYEDSAQNDFAKLPNIVLTKIFSFLSPSDRLKASMTCKSWRLGLFNPTLWQDSTLSIYLLNRFADLNSSEFKSMYLAKYTRRINLKYDPNDLGLFEIMLRIISNLNCTNLKCLTLQPNMVNLYEDEYENNSESEFKNFDFLNQNKMLFESLKQFCVNSKCVEHLALGLITDLDDSKLNMLDLLSCLSEKNSYNLKSLHISTIKNASCSTLVSSYSPRHSHSSLGQSQSSENLSYCFSNYLTQFINLTHLSIDYEHLSDDFLQSSVCVQSLKKLNLNVNSINNTINLENRLKDDSWSIAKNRNKGLRVTVNFLTVEESSRKYNYILSQFMPLETLRMYFCKSLNPDLLQFISNNYSETLKSLVIIDEITDPTLRYHNPLRHDADPDPLVLLCWKCKNLNELVLIGYEILEINLIAVAKLRNNLKKFYVPMDCIIDLRYGQFRNDDFIEDEDGEDTIVDYGFCSDQVIDKVSKILGCENWHPLEKDELPMCVYDYDLPYEEAYLETIVKDQVYE